MTFQRINDFATEDPVRLDRELSQLEDNIDKECRSIREDSQMRPLEQPHKDGGAVGEI